MRYRFFKFFLKNQPIRNGKGFVQRRILDRDNIATIIRELKEKDYYEFSEEEKQRLINE
jgi:hypothetical protein